MLKELCLRKFYSLNLILTNLFWPIWFTSVQCAVTSPVVRNMTHYVSGIKGPIPSTTFHTAYLAFLLFLTLHLISCSTLQSLRFHLSINLRTPSPRTPLKYCPQSLSHLSPLPTSQKLPHSFWSTQSLVTVYPCACTHIGNSTAYPASTFLMKTVFPALLTHGAHPAIGIYVGQMVLLCKVRRCVFCPSSLLSLLVQSPTMFQRPTRRTQSGRAYAPFVPIKSIVDSLNLFL